MEEPDFPISFGDWIKKRRKALDLTQKELAGRSGCSIFALRKIESEERKPSKQLAGLLAKALEIPVGDRDTFVRAARGELILERLGTPFPLGAALSKSGFAPRVAPPIAERKSAGRLPPNPLTPIMGRETELAAIERLFDDPQCRLLTLTGIGGIGKTRLAIEFAYSKPDIFKGGIFWVPLASVNSPEMIIPAIAEAFDYTFSGPVDPKEQWINFLKGKKDQMVLLILDNLEHLIVSSTAVVDLVTEILQRLPQIKILTTSRQRLNIQGEWMYELFGLSVPHKASTQKLDEYGSIALFVQSARRNKVGFAIQEEERSALARICHLLDGIPLAIELAAAWVGVLSCEEIAQEIASNMSFLSTTMSDVPERHRSMRASFDHSLRLLSNEERDTLRRLGVFQGGFDRQAGEQVAGASLPLLASLVSKSLVRRAENGRYDLHEVIRQFTSSNLDDDREEYQEICRRHSEFYLSLASENEKKLKSASQQATIREMTLELDNMRTAWNWGIKHGKFEPFDRAVRSLGWFYEVAGLYFDGIDQLELLIQALSHLPHDSQIDRILGMSLVQQALLYFRIGQFSRAQERYDKSIAILRPINDQALLADALIFSGTLKHLNGDYTEARALIEDGLRCAQAVNDLWFTAYGIYSLGHVDSLLGEYQKGYDQMQLGLQYWRELGDPHSISLGLNFLVDTQIKLALFEEAKSAMHESIALCEQTRNRWGMGTAYRYLGLATMAEGHYEQAQSDLRKSLEVFGESFVGWDIAISLIHLGTATLLSGDLSEAEDLYRSALHQAKEAKSTPLILEALTGLALLDSKCGKYEHALEVAILVANHTASIQETKEHALQMIADLEKKLCEEKIQVIRARSIDQSLENFLLLY